jgi:hypothetical protein
MTDIEIEFDILTGKNRDRNIVATWQTHLISSDAPMESQSRAEAATKPRASAKVSAKSMKGAAKSRDRPSLF